MSLKFSEKSPLYNEFKKFSQKTETLPKIPKTLQKRGNNSTN